MLFAVKGLGSQFPLFFMVPDALYGYQFADLGCTVKILLPGYLPGSKHALLWTLIHCKSDIHIRQVKISQVVIGFPTNKTFILCFACLGWMYNICIL